MKRTTKWLVAAAGLVLIGALVFVGAMSAARWDPAALSTVKYVTSVFETDEEIRNLSVYSDTEDTVFLPSEDGKCRVIFYESEKERHRASVQDGTLTIDRNDTRKWQDHISLFSFGSPTTTICLPEAEYASLLLEGDTGDVELPEELAFESIDLSVSTGDVVCRASAAGPLRIETDTGSIRIENLSAGELRLSVSTGRVEARRIRCAGEAEVSVSTGKVVLSDVSCGSVVSRGSSGDITLERVTAVETITVERSTGDVRFEESDAAEIAVTTDTGDVTGSLLSEKVFIARSDTGRVTVPATTSGGKCSLTTDTGDIAIEIR